MMKEDALKPFCAEDRLRDLVDDNNLLLLVVNRFRIPLGFGDSTIREICGKEDVDTDTFLAVANLISGRPYDGFKTDLLQLIDYLEEAHSYFLDFILPSIREKLIKAINCVDANDVGFLILKYFDNYMLEVHRHMEHENDVVFPHIRRLTQGLPDNSCNLPDYSLNHEDMVGKLQELKDIIIRHYTHSTNHILTYALYDIINVENDLLSHWAIENKLFMPAGIVLEEKMKDVRPSETDVPFTVTPEDDVKDDGLSNREKEIIALVAKGMANKEIADTLCLSVHTVTTHRRNIAAKLQIHSAAGLAIYAILHNIIDISEVSKL